MGLPRAGTWDLDQTRTHNAVNELVSLTGGAWVNPQYDKAGNMTTMPQPKAPTASYDAKYDAWNRLVKLTNGSLTVSEYRYNGLFHRVWQKSYDPANGTLIAYRRYYYNPSWQVLEERSGTPGTTQGEYAERQFLWDIRYIDSLVCRWRDTDLNGSSDQTLYALNDANMNVTAIVDTSGGVVERFTYDPYGKPTFRAADGAVRTYGGNYQWQDLYAGYRHEVGTGLYHVRHRPYHCIIGRWVSREPFGYKDHFGLYQYAVSLPLNKVDPFGLQSAAPNTPPNRQPPSNGPLNPCIASCARTYFYCRSCSDCEFTDPVTKRCENKNDGGCESNLKRCVKSCNATKGRNPYYPYGWPQNNAKFTPPCKMTPQEAAELPLDMVHLPRTASNGPETLETNQLEETAEALGHLLADATLDAASQAASAAANAAGAAHAAAQGLEVAADALETAVDYTPENYLLSHPELVADPEAKPTEDPGFVAVLLQCTPQPTPRPQVENTPNTDNKENNQ